MKSVTTWGDVFSLNVWVNLHSRFSWLSGIAIAAALAIQTTAPQWQQGGRPVGVAVAVILIMFVALMIGIALISCVLIFVAACAHLLRKGCIGPKQFTISAETFSEDDGRQVTTVPWEKVRSIDKTRRHIFIRISRWKFMLLSARDFEHEYQFAQYYADLLKARHERTRTNP